MGAATPTPPHHKMSAIAGGRRATTTLESLLLKSTALYLFLIAGSLLLVAHANATALAVDDAVALIECYQRFFPMTDDPFDYTKGTFSSPLDDSKSDDYDYDALILGRQKGDWIERCLKG